MNTFEIIVALVALFAVLVAAVGAVRKSVSSATKEKGKRLWAKFLDWLEELGKLLPQRLI